MKRLLTSSPLLLALVGLMFFVWSCQPMQPLPQPRRAVDPSTTQGSVRTPQWDVAAVAYQNPGQGLDYARAGLAPVFLVFKNKSQSSPQVLLSEVRGLGAGGQYLVYSVDEAARLVLNSEEFNNTAQNMLRSGATGAAAGAGLGALIGLLSGGNDRIWQGALIGGAVGGTAGAVSTMGESRRQLRDMVYQELGHYQWRENPIPPFGTQSGYLYLPGNMGISGVQIVVRTPTEVVTHTLPIVGAGNYQY